MSERPAPIRLLVADDHLIVREGLRLILELAEDISLVGEAGDGAEAVRLAHELSPDVVLMDLRMPGMDGIAATEQLRRELPQVAVVILTTYNEDELMLQGLKAGARGFLLKDTGRESLFDAIRMAARGETLLRPDVMRRLLEHTQSGQPVSAPPTTQTAGAPTLTEREREVLRRVAAGDRNKEIAVRLHITERTVKAHLDSIYNKLGVDSRAAAVSEGLRLGVT